MTSDSSFEKVYLDNHAYVRNFCVSLSSKSIKFDIDDIVQNTFIKVFKNFDKFDGSKASIRTWICAIAKNEACDYMRKTSKGLVFIDKSMDAATHGDIRSVAELRSSRDKLYMEEEQKFFDDHIIKIFLALDTLPDNQKRAIRLHYLDGLKYEDVSRKMGVTTANVRWIAKRGIDKIRSIVGGTR